MATKIVIPTTYGSPSATFWINDQKHVFPTGVEVTVSDEVATLISQHENQRKREEAQVHPDVVDVLFSFEGFNGEHAFAGTSNKSFEDIIRELGDRGIEHINICVKTSKTRNTPFRVEMSTAQITTYWLGSGGESSDEYALRIYTASITTSSGLSVTGKPKAIISADVIELT